MNKEVHADWPWADEEAMWGRCTATEAAVKTDHAAAMVWMKEASQQGREVPLVDITATDASRPPVTGTSAESHEACSGLPPLNHICLSLVPCVHVGVTHSAHATQSKHL